MTEMKSPLSKVAMALQIRGEGLRVALDGARVGSVQEHPFVCSH